MPKVGRCISDELILIGYAIKKNIFFINIILNKLRMINKEEKIGGVTLEKFYKEL